jgi:hypothetical protein
MACTDFTEEPGTPLDHAVAKLKRARDVEPKPFVSIDQALGVDKWEVGTHPTFTSVKDSGKRESFESGAVRDTQDGKPRYDLIPVRALYRLANHYANGAKKYGDHNWEKGIPTSRCVASALRHIYSWLLGDCSEDHLSAVLFNIMAIIHFEEADNAQ